MSIRVARFSIVVVAKLIAAALPAAGAAEAHADAGWFVEAGVRHVESGRLTGQFAVDDEQTGWSAGVGYTFTDYFAVQADWLDLGRDHFATDCPPPNICLVVNTDEVDLAGYALSAVARWPVSERFDVFGKFGVIGWDSDFDTRPLDQSGENLLIGIGCGFNVSPHWRLALQYEDYGFDVESSSLNASYHFGA